MKDFVGTKRIVIKTMAPAVRRSLLDARDRAVDLLVRTRCIGGHQGALPNFLIVGTQKGGTTFLYDELVKHPQIMGALTKEVHYFDANFDKAADWYRAFFPTAETLAARGAITGEASPSYLFHPHAARRIHALAPQIKIIMLLRNPIARAYSHYHHEVRLGYEDLPFAEAIAREEERLTGEHPRMLADETYYSAAYMHYSYLTRGHYFAQLQQWHALFPAEQILTLKSEDFYANPAVALQEVLAFLALPTVDTYRQDQHKTFPYAKMDSQLRTRLHTYFAAHNAELYDYLQQDYGWA